MTRILIAQINPTFGDFAGNAKKILNALKDALAQNCSLVVTPELALSGYPPNDILFSKLFLKAHDQALMAILEATKGTNIRLILGCLEKNDKPGKPLFNQALNIFDGTIYSYQSKSLLPTYDVFDEQRYFEPRKGTYCFHHDGKKIALSICEDIWSHQMSPLYAHHPIEQLKSQNLDLLLNLSASPFEIHKWPQRLSLVQEVSEQLKCPVLYCNQVGGNDDLIFDGHSFLCDGNSLLDKAPGFQESFYVVDLKSQEKKTFQYKPTQELYYALSLGIRDYFHKQGFKKAVLGLSGGIDSAIVACLLKEALGAQNVTALLLPSRYSSKESITDALELSKNLKIEHHQIEIESLHDSALKTLHPFFKDLPEDLTEENIQARLRGLLLMAYSNKLGHLVVGCSNKSEMAIGYATLYGDMIGALCPLGDVSKTQVYALADFIQSEWAQIPKNIILKAPSAELRPDQKDSDSLPPYDLLDGILESYIEKGFSTQEIAKRIHKPLEEVETLVKQLHRSEYKRRQSPLILKVTQKAFSSGWRFPIVQKWMT